MCSWSWSYLSYLQVLVQEQPIACVLLAPHLTSHCSTCLRPAVAGLACGSCSQVTLYCFYYFYYLYYLYYFYYFSYIYSHFY